MVGFDPAGAVTAGITELTGVLGTVAPAAIGVAAAILAVTFGWRLVKKFAK